MQRCKPAYGLCKGGKVNTEKEDRVRRGGVSECKGANRSGAPVQRWKGELQSEDRVRSTDYGWKVGAGQDRVQSTE
jgi:hypothetical protein